MRICLIGAGAVGGMLAARFAATSAELSIVEVDHNFAAIRDNGLTLHWNDGRHFFVHPNVYNSIAEAGFQDLIVLAVKAHVLPEIASQLRKVAPETVLLTVQNGIPWWYFQRSSSKYEGRILTSVDPAGTLSRNVDPRQIIGCIAYPAAILRAPGQIEHIEGNRFAVGELDGTQSERVERIRDLFIASGLKSRVLTDVRSELWLKAWGALSFNPISALTHASLTHICSFPESRRLARDMMREAELVAQRLGITFRHTIEERIEGAAKVGAHKTSMLQDVESGRSLEVAALLGVVLELAEMTGTQTPTIAAIHACTLLLNDVITTQRVGFVDAYAKLPTD